MAGISKRVSGAWVSGSERIMKTATDIIVPPTTIYTDGTAATISLKGNTVQNGTPTPSSPVDVNGASERTENLFDIENITHEFLGSDGAISYESAMDLSVLIRVDGDYTVSWNAVRSGAYMRVSTYDYNKNFIARIVAEGTYTHSSYSNTHIGYIRINYENSYQLSDVQVNTGSTALPYEPYGYKIPISSANTTTPVYLGEVQTTRKIRKLVLDGTENWYEGTPNYYIFINVQGSGEGIPNSDALCTHAENGVVVNNNGTALFFKKSVFVQSSLADFKTYLQQQYANGTPVTVWYILAESETGIVNEPLMKVSNYADSISGISIPTTAGADTLSVDTTLQPSEVTANYHGWHEGTVHERDNGAWT